MGDRDITSNIKLFTGSTLLNGQVHNSDNAISLKSNLDKLVQWETLWQIILSLLKCYVLRVCRTKNPLIYPNTMLGQTLSQSVDHQPHLGVNLSNLL